MRLRYIYLLPGLNLVIYSFNGRSGINSQCLKESGYSRSRSDDLGCKVVEPLHSDICQSIQISSRYVRITLTDNEALTPVTA